MAATLSSVVWTVGLVVVSSLMVLGAAAVVVGLRRRSTITTTSTTTRSAPVIAPTPLLVDAPMIGLESALSQVTDRSGRPLREHIDAEQRHVDELRVPDDTGPLLRRALDHVEQPGPKRDPAVNTANDPA